MNISDSTIVEASAMVDVGGYSTSSNFYQYLTNGYWYKWFLSLFFITFFYYIKELAHFCTILLYKKFLCNDHSSQILYAHIVHQV